MSKFWTACFVGMRILWVLTFCVQAQAQASDTIKKNLPAMKTNPPPTIDGRIDDLCWGNAPQAVGFTDGLLGTPPEGRTVVWVLYDDRAIYVACHASDSQPDKIVARQTKDQTQLFTDDTFAVAIDPFHAHQWMDQNIFRVNPLGTKWTQISGGRAEKPEWLGLWKAAAQIGPDGWTAEMEIPWQMLTYPDTKGPVTMGINFDRHQQRTGAQSYWSNVTSNDFLENAGHWVGVLPPPKAADLKILPYVYAGRRPASEHEITARAGLDARYAVTPQMSLVATLNPDFENVEQAVEGIDFSYGQRFVPDRRPFFQEGRSIFLPGFRYGEFYHSRQISEMDAGVNLFGKLSNRMLAGALGTFHQDGNLNAIVRLRQSVGTNGRIAPAYIVHRDDAGANHVGQIEAGTRHGPLGIGADYAQSWNESEMGRVFQVFASFQNAGYSFALQPFFIEPTFVNKLGFHPFTGIRGGKAQLEVEREWRAGPARRLELFGGVEGSDRYEGDIFRRAAQAQAWVHTRNDYALFAGWEGGQYETFHDRAFIVGFQGRVTDQFTNYRVTYSWGRRAGQPIRFLEPRVSLKIASLTAGIQSQFLWHTETQRQHIFTLTYDFTPALSLGGRFVWREEQGNVYFALRRSGYAGTDLFVILGDPNAERFQRRLIAKVIRPF